MNKFFSLKQNLNRTVLILIGIVLVWYRCYLYSGIAPFWDLIDKISYGLFFVMLFYSFKEISFSRHKYPTLILISTFISATIAVIFWNESAFREFGAMHNYQLVLVYFILCKLKADNVDVERALVILALLYVCCWIYQVSKVPEMIFGADHDTDISNTESRGFFRFFIPTKENMPLLSLFAYELYRRTKKTIYLAFVPICFLIVVLHVGRQMIAWSFVSIFLLLLYHNRKKWKRLVVVSVALYFVGNILIENVPTLNLLFDKTTTQLDSAEDDIRTACIKYYLENSIANPVTFLFGNGLGADGQLYAFTQRSLTFGFYESDIGFVALLFDFGLFGVLIYLMLFFRILRMPVEPKYIYLKCYIIYIYGSYILAHNLTTNIFFNMCALYILFTSNKKCIIQN